jgi:acetoin utilization deacetylase AcuC-like enzyme
VTTAILRDDLFLRHDPGEDHPESARRLLDVYRLLDEWPVAGTFTPAVRPATRAEITRIHDGAFVDLVARTSERAQTALDSETWASARTYEAALAAAGATLRGVELVVSGEAESAFALVRPPGHHAEAARAFGFCFFNNVAIAAAHAIGKAGLARVLVLDPDVHHGNGTQHAFWTRSDVLYVSSHQYPFFPGTGAVNEWGEGKGTGYTLNMPLPAGAGDGDLLYLYERIVGPVVESFEPELILVSAGYDAWKGDPLGGFRVTRPGFRALFTLFRGWAERYAAGRMVLTLEGGYDPPALAACVRDTLEVLAGDAVGAVDDDPSPGRAARRVAYRLWSDGTTFWPALARSRV